MIDVNEWYVHTALYEGKPTAMRCALSDGTLITLTRKKDTKWEATCGTRLKTEFTLAPYNDPWPIAQKEAIKRLSQIAKDDIERTHNILEMLKEMG